MYKSKQPAKRLLATQSCPAFHAPSTNYSDSTTTFSFRALPVKLATETGGRMAETVFADELVDSVRLSLVSGVGPLLRKALLERFGTPAAVLAASKDELQAVDGIGPKIAARILAAHEEIDAEAELQMAAENGIDVLTEADDDYPRPLRQIHDPPGVLFRRGQPKPQDEMAVAIVGTRHATRYGLAQAERLAASLARTGFTVVSGLARGIDAAAHRGALAAGGRTIAVLASGLLEIYPPEHVKLADEVAASGYLLSEAPPRMVPLSGAFPQRNRIISGLIASARSWWKRPTVRAHSSRPGTLTNKAAKCLPCRGRSIAACRAAATR